MNITLFDIKKHESSIRKLKTRKAPNYIFEAYKSGYIDTVNVYYDIKLQRKLGRKLEESVVISRESLNSLESSDKNFVQEAFKQRDEDFLRAFFIMTNLDIMTGNKLPPSAGSLLKQGVIKDLGLKDLYKKLR